VLCTLMFFFCYLVSVELIWSEIILTLHLFSMRNLSQTPLQPPFYEEFSIMHVLAMPKNGASIFSQVANSLDRFWRKPMKCVWGWTTSVSMTSNQFLHHHITIKLPVTKSGTNWNINKLYLSQSSWDYLVESACNIVVSHYISIRLTYSNIVSRSSHTSESTTPTQPYTCFKYYEGHKQLLLLALMLQNWCSSVSQMHLTSCIYCYLLVIKCKHHLELEL
jgi:hypothetical protein